MEDPCTPGFITGTALIRFAHRLGYEITLEHATDIDRYRESTEPSIAALRARTDISSTIDPAHIIHAVQRSAHGVEHTMNISQLASGSMRSHTLAHETVATALARLRVAHERFNCTIHFLEESALERAQSLDESITVDSIAEVATKKSMGESEVGPGLLAGVPFTVKDVIDVAGSPTSGGSCTGRDAKPATRSAFAVERLELAGAIPIAKDSTTEFAASGPDSPLIGVCTNPWDTSRWAGGSSSGTAVAIATGAVPFGVGTDVGGSIRLPSAWCGITGLKPTAGRVSRSGVIPMSWTAEVVGPMARDATTVSAVFSVMAGEDPDDPRTHAGSAVTATEPRELAGLSLVVPTDPLFKDCDASITRGICEVVDVLNDEGVTNRETQIPDAANAHDAGYQIVFPELASVHRPLETSWKDYGPMTSRRMSRGIMSPVSDYLRAQQFGHHLQTVLLRELAEASAILVPTVAGSAPTHADAMMTINGKDVPAFGHQARITMICNLTGFPGLSFPIGFDAAGLPVSGMLIGRPNEEHLLLAFAQMYQARTFHHTKRPTLSH